MRDDSPDAFARVVDRLLASPHYGERWARHWLDVARYGEDQAHTFQARKYPQGFRYRDWLIQRLQRRHAVRPVRPGADRRRPARRRRTSWSDLPALGFFALGPVYYGDRQKLDQIDDRIDTLTRGFLGLTVACARCHDHKFDPISTQDYYALAGVFASTRIRRSRRSFRRKKSKRREGQADRGRGEEKEGRRQSTRSSTPSRTPKADAPCACTSRGNPDNLGDEAPRRFLAILGGEQHGPFTARQRPARAGPTPSPVRDNPLTARVIVNRVWQHHFGRGLVRTPSNFGTLGERPTHPELLDHLASRFIASGWSLKTLHREIMLSAAYQQAQRLRRARRARSIPRTGCCGG